MIIKEIYQVVARMVEDDIPEWADDSYEFTLVVTTNKHFAQMIERMYQKMIDNETPSDYLKEWCFHGLWYTEEVCINTLKCFM